jgi:cytochrome c peroxidase
MDASWTLLRCAGLAGAVLLLASASAAQRPIRKLPQVPVPVGNPITPEKVLLGQALFFEEQLSSDDTMACATCHLPEAGGGDPRAGARAPGVDGLLGTPDDEFGSPGVLAQDEQGDYRGHPLFGLERQATGRNSPTVIGAAFFDALFWDSRAGPEFRDLAGTIVLAEHAALENQAVEPPLSAVEMSHAGRDWAELTGKLAAVRPLDLASDLPPALAGFIGDSTSYGPLFERAFGTREITRERIAMAIATYERTLIPDHTPFARGTMTPRQREGLRVYLEQGFCTVCHPVTNGLFSDGLERTIFLPDHERTVKTPTLLNIGLRRRFMSSGQHTSLEQVLDHYKAIGMLFATNDERAALLDFLENALTDPRVANAEPPFDRPTLRSELEPHGSRLFGQAAGDGRFPPHMLADVPAHLGNARFQIGVGGGPGGALAVLVLSGRPSPPGTVLHGVPVYVDLAGASLQPQRLSGSGPGQGLATYRTALPLDAALLGQRFYAQWFVLDGTGGLAVSEGARYELFSRSGGAGGG